MGKSNYYESDAFKELDYEWKQKLEDSGFQDIEKSEDGYKLRKQTFDAEEPIKHQMQVEQNNLCHRILSEYSFKRDLDKLIFELHTQGLSVRQIESYLTKHAYKSIYFTRIGRIINQIKKDFLRTKS
jgi:hypothetical protein